MRREELNADCAIGVLYRWRGVMIDRSKFT